MKRGKKYIEAAKLIDRGTFYDAEEAVGLVKKAAVAKFDETVEAHIRLGVDGRHADQQVQVKLLKFLYSLKVTKLLKLKQLEQISLVEMS